MDVGTGVGLLSLVALVLANGFFVAAEFAIVAVRKSRLEQLAAEGNTTARATQQVIGRLDTYIAACQLGITMASLALGWVGEPALAHVVEPPLELVVGQFAPAAAHGVAIAVSFAIITALHIVVGELAPKGLALQRPEGTALWITRPLQLFEAAFRWPIRLLNGVGNGVLRVFGLEPASGHEMVHSVEELRLLVKATQQAGGVEASEARIASRAFTFADLTAGALMTPRTEVEGIPVDLPLSEVRQLLATTLHTRVPVYQTSLDTVLGVLHVVDFYRALDSRRAVLEFPHDRGQVSGTPATGGHAPASAAPLRLIELPALLRPVMVVPESKPADDLLDEMRVTGRYFAVVIDEYGGTAGIVTIDDLLEALVGQIRPESTADGSGGSPPDVAAQPDGTLLVDGLMRLKEWEEATGVPLDAAFHEAVETIGGAVMMGLSRIPQIGDEVTFGNRTVRVEALDGMRVARVRLLPRADAPPADFDPTEDQQPHE